MHNKSSKSKRLEDDESSTETREQTNILFPQSFLDYIAHYRSDHPDFC